MKSFEAFILENPSLSRSQRRLALINEDDYNQLIAAAKREAYEECLKLRLLSVKSVITHEELCKQMNDWSAAIESKMKETCSTPSQPS